MKDENISNFFFQRYYKYNTTKRNEEYPFPEELMTKLTDIADGKSNEEENRMRDAWLKFLCKVPLSDKQD